MHYTLEHTAKKRKSSKIKKNQNPVSKQQIRASSQFAGLLLGLALTRPQLLEKTDVVQRSLSKWQRRWQRARPASSQHQSAQGLQPRPPHCPCPTLRAGWALLGRLPAGRRLLSLPARTPPPLPAPGHFCRGESRVRSERLSPPKCGRVGCQKVLSWNFETLNLNSIPYTWGVLNLKIKEIYCINMF